jgi:hypothetical protein
MVNKSFMKLAILHLFTILAFMGLAHASGINNNEIEFTGNVESVAVNGKRIGTLFINVDNIRLTVIVNSKTIIQDQAEELLTMEELDELGNEELRVSIQGKYSSNGIAANRIRVVESSVTEDTFVVRGHVTQIQEGETGFSVSLLGVAILIDENTIVKKDGIVVPAEEIRIGSMLTAMGSIAGDLWTATQVHILSPGKKKEILFFEGTVESYDPESGDLEIFLDGPPGGITTPVLVTSETKVQGTIETGAYVLVIGTLNQDYVVTAKEVRVLSTLEIKPDTSRMSIAEEKTFTVKLREPAGSDVTVNLGVDVPSVLELSATSVVVASGSQTAHFNATALAQGTAVITAEIEGSGETATATVEVEDGSEEDQEVQTFFSPDHIKLYPNASREVVLHIDPPQAGEVAVIFSGGEDALFVETARDLSNGSAKYKVNIESLGDPGTYTVVATLPEELGGYTAELTVTVIDKKQ